MNKFFFLIILFGLASAVGLGMLSNEFTLFIQGLGVFHGVDDNVILAGCECVDGSELVACDHEIFTHPLCPP